jgi:hypothetical protein
MIPVWRKSSYSTEQEFGTCVEVAEFDDGGIGVRDSKNPAGPHLSFSRGAWAGFIAQIAPARGLGDGRPR